MKDLNDAEKKKVAAGNLSQLDIFVGFVGSGGYAYAAVPDNAFVKNVLLGALNDIGFTTNQSNDAVEIVNTSCSLDRVLSSPGSTNQTLRFSPEGVEKLLEAGVRTPSLDALREILQPEKTSHAAKVRGV